MADGGSPRQVSACVIFENTLAPLPFKHLSGKGIEEEERRRQQDEAAEAAAEAGDGSDSDDDPSTRESEIKSRTQVSKEDVFKAYKTVRGASHFHRSFFSNTTTCKPMMFKYICYSRGSTVTTINHQDL